MTAGFKRRKIDPQRVIEAAKESLVDVVKTVTASGYEPGQTYEVPLDRIKANPFNARVLYTSATIASIAQSIQLLGQTTAASGFLDGDAVVLIDGHRRWKACQHLKLESLRVEIRPHPGDNSKLYLASRTANVEREDQTPLDDALVWKQLLAKKVFPTQVALAKAVGASESEVSRTLSLSELTPKVVEVLAEKPTLLNLKMLNALREFQQSLGEEKTLTLIKNVIRWEWSYRDVEARRKQAAATPAVAQLAYTPFEFKGAKGSLRFDDKARRVDFHLSGLPSKDYKEMVQQIRALLGVA